MTAIIDKILILKLNQDIIRENILPYTYNIQQNEILIDINSYKEQHLKIVNLYMLNRFKEYVLYYDLTKFYCMLKNFEYYKFINRRGKFIITYKDTLFLFRLLTNKERIQFINKYVVEFI